MTERVAGSETGEMAKGQVIEHYVSHAKWLGHFL